MTLSTSNANALRAYGLATVLCAVFSTIYECFSHGVISWWMVGLCGFPLLLGVMPALACGILGVRVSHVARQLWACGVMTLVMGSCLAGVLEIYGTTSVLVRPYLPLGLVLLALATTAQVLVRTDDGRARA